MSLDFMLDKYTELCNEIRTLSCKVMTVAQFLKAGQPQHFVVILRHDIDRSIFSALRMAELEAGLGIRSTYYARMTPSVFSSEALAHLYRLGHEVGYHYDVLSKTKGDCQRAIAVFEQELEQFRKIIPVETISMHGSPLLPWNNLDLWQDYDFTRYGLSDASLSVDYQHVYYFTDTGRSWEAGRYNLRDRVVSRKPRERIRNTDELIFFLRQRPDGPVLINTHPNRWATNRGEWAVSVISDWGINQMKRLAAWRRDVLAQKNSRSNRDVLFYQ